MTKATTDQVRQHYETQGYEVRIDADGRVEYRPDPDEHPGCSNVWLEGRWVSEYRVDPDAGVYLS